MKIHYKEITGEPKTGDVSNWNKGSIAKIIMETKETQVKRVRKAGQWKNVKVSKVRKATQFGTKCGRRKKGAFHVEYKEDKPEGEDEEKEKYQVTINKKLEEKMKKAALKGGMSYEVFQDFLKNLEADDNDQNIIETKENEISDSDSDTDYS